MVICQRLVGNHLTIKPSNHQTIIFKSKKIKMAETKVSFTNLTKEDIIKRTEALLPLIKERALSTDKNRKPDDEVIQKLGEAGIFAACVPKRFGGAELNIDTIAAVGRLIAQHSMSTAWVSCFYMGHNVMLCKFPEKAQETVFCE